MIKQARVLVSMCDCVWSRIYWSDWRGGSFVMNKSFLHTTHCRAYTDPSQNTEVMWLNPLTEHISLQWPIPTKLSQKLIDSRSVNSFLSQAEKPPQIQPTGWFIHHTLTNYILKYQLVLSWHLQHRCTEITNSVLKWLYSHQFLMRQIESPALGY